MSVSQLAYIWHGGPNRLLNGVSYPDRTVLSDEAIEKLPRGRLQRFLDLGWVSIQGMDNPKSRSASPLIWNGTPGL